ncbi:MAG: hypothetical protein IH988_08190 [Planctomycetes bacterium]|nr:hypothetical protein [Planctomycetota bacterium]
MLSTAPVKRLTIHTLAIPLRSTVSHAAATRRIADPVVVAIELRSGVVGYGETLPRSYVTGETVGSVVGDIRGQLVPRLLEMRPTSFPEALESIDALPMVNDRGIIMTAARAAVELALLDAYARHFDRPIDQLAGWLGVAGLGPPGSLGHARFSATLFADEIGGCLRRLRKMRWYGVRHFTLKVGLADDAERVGCVHHALRRLLRTGRGSLRLDADGAWNVSQAVVRLSSWSNLGIQAVEQPLPKGSEDDLLDLADEVAIPFVHDESLVTLDDARRLVDLGVAGAFNIRISKCGGLLPALKLALFARKHGVRVRLGCMVGETSILSAAGIQFLSMMPGVVAAEGSFGPMLLRQDVCGASLRFRYGGRPPRIRGPGLGITVDEGRLTALALEPPQAIEL